MAQPYVGEIRIFGGNFAPAGWMFCNGASLPISENETLFQLIGTTFGGDGEQTFNLPDLRGRAPLHSGKGPALPTTYIIGQQGGVETVTLTTQQLPIHTHAFVASTGVGTQNGPISAVIASGGSISPFRPAPTTVPFATSAISFVGGNQPHENRQPYIAISYIISLFGIFPSPT
jgi:microcystin-dependent protein